MATSNNIDNSGFLWIITSVFPFSSHVKVSLLLTFLDFFAPPSVSFSILLIIQVLWFFCDQIKVIQYLIDESTVLLEKINSASSPEIDEKILVQYGGSDSLTPQVAMARLRLQVRNETYTNKQLINPKKRAFWNSSSICSSKYAISEKRIL